MSIKKATLVGIDHYPWGNDLAGCIKDAADLSDVLERHGDRNRKNFDCKLVTSAERQAVDSKRIRHEIDSLFSEPASCVLFYYAGHGRFDPGSSKGYFVLPDGHGSTEEYPFDHLIETANHARGQAIISTIIILDCCGAGAAGETRGPNTTFSSSVIGPGVTMLAAASRDQRAIERSGTGGLFTQYMIEALRGSAADLRGIVTPASIYAHIDQMLGVREPRPVYKANVQDFIALRECPERIPLDTLHALPTLFPTADHEIKLSPEHEPNRDNVPKWMMEIPPDPVKVAAFTKLQALNRQGLVVPVGAEHMYYAAIKRKSCKLTELGKHYRELVLLRRI